MANVRLLPVVLRVGCLLLALSGAACGSMQNNPRQTYTYEVGRKCETFATKLERVESDGRYWIQARGDAGIASTEYPKFFACMKDQFQAHPYLDWLKAQNRDAVQPPVAVGSASPAAAALSVECTPFGLRTVGT